MQTIISLQAAQENYAKLAKKALQQANAKANKTELSSVQLYNLTQIVGQIIRQPDGLQTLSNIFGEKNAALLLGKGK